MILVLALSVGLLVSFGIFLVLQKGLFRVIMGFSLLAHGANLMVLAAAGEPGTPAILRSNEAGAGVTDPLPQALVLTAIVISMAVTLYLLTLLAEHGRSGLDVSLEPAPTSDEGREPVQIAKEIRGEEAK